MHKKGDEDSRNINATFSDHKSATRQEKSGSASTNGRGRSGNSRTGGKNTPTKKRQLPYSANRAFFNLKLNLDDRREQLKLIKDGKSQSYSLNKNSRQIKTAKAGERIPGSRFFKPSQVSIEWVNQPDRSTSIQRHGYNVQSANLTSNQHMLL